MYRAKLCLGLNPQYGLPYEDQIRLFRSVGFEGFFVNWTPDINLASLRKTADETGMVFQSVHGPFLKTHSIWHEDEHTQEAVDELLACLKDCALNKIPIMVTHAFIGFEDHTPTPDGLERFDRIVSEAARLGVQMAFENTEGEEYLAALMDRYREQPHVGFCWDTGHEMCYNDGKDMLSLYGDRLLCAHLNDNLGVSDFGGRIIWTDDLHLLPFDGIGDWANIASRLKRHHYQDFLTFELKIKSLPGRRENDPYARMEIADYVTAAYMRACRVAALFLRA